MTKKTNAKKTNTKKSESVKSVPTKVATKKLNSKKSDDTEVKMKSNDIPVPKSDVEPIVLDPTGDPETDAQKVWHVMEVTCPDKTTKYRKRFDIEKRPTHAVVCEMIGGGYRVLRWSVNAKTCQSDVVRVTKRFIANKERFVSASIVACRDLGPQDGPIDPEFIEDRTGSRINRAYVRANEIAKTDPEKSKQILASIEHLIS